MEGPAWPLLDRKVWGGDVGGTGVPASQAEVLYMHTSGSVHESVQVERKLIGRWARQDWEMGGHALEPTSHSPSQASHTWGGSVAQKAAVE